MILLGINAGLGNADVGRLHERHLNLKTGWLDFPRPKTAVNRRAWLWPETIASIKEAIKQRPAPATKAEAGLVFLRTNGHRWFVEQTLPAPKNSANGDSLEVSEEVTASSMSSPLVPAMWRLLVSQGLHRPGLGFYTLAPRFPDHR